MKGYKLLHKQPVTYGNGKPGVVSTYCKDRGGVGKDMLVYVLRAGKKGTGQEVVRARCRFLCREQERANKRMEQRAGTIMKVEGEPSPTATKKKNLQARPCK